MGLFGIRSSGQLAPQRTPPRDIEALSELVANLEGATVEASTWRIYACTYLEIYDLASAAV